MFAVILIIAIIVGIIFHLCGKASDSSSSTSYVSQSSSSDSSDIVWDFDSAVRATKSAYFDYDKPMFHGSACNPPKDLDECYRQGISMRMDDGYSWHDGMLYIFYAAAHGHAHAQADVGSEIIFAKHNIELGTFWLWQSAEQGNMYGEFLLANLLDPTSSTHCQAASRDESIYWYQRAAEHGHACAQLRVGECYYSGNGVAKDLNQAIFWLKKASENEVSGSINQSASELLETCYKELN